MRKAREHERVTAEERRSPESGSGGGQERGPVEERPQSTRGGRHGALVARCPQPQESKRARQLLDELLRPGGAVGGRPRCCEPHVRFRVGCDADARGTAQI